MSRIVRGNRAVSGTPPDKHGESDPAVLPFPTQCVGETSVARRGLLKWFSLALLAMVVPAFSRNDDGSKHSPRPPKPFRAGSLSKLNKGDSFVVRDPKSDAPILVLRAVSGEIRAYDQRCTHLMCPVSFDRESGRIVCPCHRGFFSASTGAPVAGPARTPLRRYTVALKGDGDIWLTFEAARRDQGQGVRA